MVLTEYNKISSALAGVAYWIEGWPRNQKVVDLIPSQGTCLGYGPGSPVGGMGEATNRCIFNLKFKAFQI